MVDDRVGHTGWINDAIQLEDVFEEYAALKVAVVAQPGVQRTANKAAAFGVIVGFLFCWFVFR